MADEIVRERVCAGALPEMPPVHEENPKARGGHAPRMASGNNRWRIHAMNHANRVTLQTHRVAPVVEVDPHIQCMETEWQPIPTDRGVPCEFEKA